MVLEEVLERMAGPDRIRVMAGEKEVYAGFAGAFRYEAEYREHLKSEVERLGATLDITHRKHKEKGLLPPLHPEQTPDYRFSDLQTTLYFKITIKEEV
nr:hypothetical protein [uncultured Acetatifactor sp.]